MREPIRRRGNSRQVLVLDGNGQAGLSIVRSLGRRGIPVTAGSPCRWSLGRVSRYSDDAYVYPEPATSADRFIADLCEYLRAVDHFAVVPVRDNTSALLSMHKSEIEATGTIVAIEDYETFERTYDKGRLFGRVGPLAVTTPGTFVPASPNAVEAIAPKTPYPAVVKPRSKTVWDEGGQCHTTEIDDTHYVESPEDLVSTYREVLERYPVLEDLGCYPLVQEYVEGTTTTMVVLADEGAIVASFQEERVRTHPSSGGNSTLLRALCEPRMVTYTREVIEELEWTGPAMVEFMRTPDGEFYLIEVNGRYWGSVPFAIESGVDIPWLHYLQLCGGDLGSVRSYRMDVLQHRLLNQDLKWLGEQLCAGNPAALPSFLWTCVVAKQTFLSYRDPWPTILAPCQTVELGIRALVRRLGNAAG